MSNMTPAALAAFQGLQNSWGQPIQVNSAYRSPADNARVGGAKHSQHMKGNAYDIDVSGLPEADRLRMIAEAKAAGFQGVGVYNNALHFDVGPSRAWGPSHGRESIPAWAREAVGANQQSRGQPMGLLGPGSAPQQEPGALERMTGGFLTPDRVDRAIIAMQGMTMNPNEALMRNAQANINARRDEAANTKGAARAAEFVKANNPQLASAIAGGFISPKEGVGLYLRAEAAKASGVDTPTYGLTPQYITTPDGKLQILQLANDGSPAKMVDLPEGAALQKGVQKLDLGTHFQWYNNVTGEPIGKPIQKEIREAASESAIGSAQGAETARIDIKRRDMEASMEGLMEVVARLDDLADTATYTGAGQMRDEFIKQTGGETTQGAIARAEYIAVVDNQVLPLLRQTFGPAFTVEEGKQLRNTLGDPDKSPAEKKAVLRAFIAQKARDVEALGGSMPAEAAETLRQNLEGGGKSPEAQEFMKPPSEMTDDELLKSLGVN